MRKQNNNNNGTNGFGIDRTLLWDDLPGERLRKNIILLLLLLLSFIFIVLVERTQVPEKKEKEDEVPERLARFIQERQQEEPPQPEEPEEEEEEKDEEKEEEEDEPEEPEEEPETQEEKVEQARETAQKELEVFDKQLSGLRDMAPDQQQDGDNLRRGGAESAEVERDLITSRAGQGSGGVQTGSVSSGGGGGGTLEGGETTEVESTVAEKGQAASETRETREGKSQRTREQIRRVFDRYGGRMQSAYVRARRKNPALQGTVVLDLEIAPSGKVTDVSVKSSELNAPELEQKLLVIVQMMDFGKMDVEPWNGDWTLNFFPG
jgi:TonB family protein